MKVKAAVAHKAGAPLTVEAVDLEGPKAGEVLVEVNKGFDLMHEGKSIRSVVVF